MSKSVPDELTIWNAMVMMNVWIGFTLGITAKMVSPTSPREVEATPDSLIRKLWKLNSCATAP